MEGTVDAVEKNLFESFGEVASLAANLLRDWPEELDGQHKELRRLAEDIGVHLPTCREETAAAGYVLLHARFECNSLHIYFREEMLQNVSECWLYVILLYPCTSC